MHQPYVPTGMTSDDDDEYNNDDHYYNKISNRDLWQGLVKNRSMLASKGGDGNVSGIL